MVPKMVPMRLNSALVDKVCDAQRVSNRELARRAGLSPQFLLRLRRGDRTASEGTIKCIGEALELPLETVLLPHQPRQRVKDTP